MQDITVNKFQEISLVWLFCAMNIKKYNTRLFDEDSIKIRCTFEIFTRISFIDGNVKQYKQYKYIVAK